MAQKPSTPAKPATPGKGAVAPVAPTVPGTKSVPAAALSRAASASATAPAYGGLRGGRKRADGLIPGSKEALEADQEKDAQRKRDERAAARALVEPPPLPSSNGQTPAPAGPLAALAAPGEVPPVLWTPEVLTPLVVGFHRMLEEMRITTRVNLATKAKLEKSTVADVKQKSQWNEVSKRTLDTYGPKVAAKWLNKTGISAEHAEEMAYLTAFGQIALADFMLNQSLRQLIKQNNPEPAKPVQPNEKDKPQNPAPATPAVQVALSQSPEGN